MTAIDQQNQPGQVKLLVLWQKKNSAKVLNVVLAGKLDVLVFFGSNCFLKQNCCNLEAASVVPRRAR